MKGPWGWFVGTLARQVRSQVLTAHPRDPVLASWFGGDMTAAGVSVNADSALRVGAVWACVSLIAETIAALPLHVHKREGEISSKATNHPLYPLLHDQPTAAMTSFEWREMLVTHTALRGDSYARIIELNNGRIASLEPLHPDTVTPEWSPGGRVRYRWQPREGGVRILLDDEVLRFPFKMLDGLHSQTPIALHRDTVGMPLAAQRYLAAFYANSAQPKGGLKVPTTINDAAAEALRASWNKRHQGPENAGKIAIFDGGMEWQTIGMSNDDAQYLELQQLSVSDIARIFLVPPHKIGDLSKATFSNIEHQAIEFVTDTLLRWCRRLEQRMNMSLLSQADRKAGFYVSFDLKGLLRGDATARANLYKALFYIGALSPNEIRAAEDLNPIADGDHHYVQGGAIPIDMVEQIALKGQSTTKPEVNDQ